MISYSDIKMRKGVTHAVLQTLACINVEGLRIGLLVQLRQVAKF